MQLKNTTLLKLEKLLEFLKGKKVIVAYSGGVDSSLLAYLASQYSQKTLAVSVKSNFISKTEISEATEFARQYDIPHRILQVDLLEHEIIRSNPKNRCYYCKKELYSKLIKIQEEMGLDVILDGSNTDDLEDFRPGAQAIKELNIATPYLDSEISKEEIREISKYYGLSTHSKPSMACIASRFQYDYPLEEQKIKKILEAEAFLREKFNFEQLRVRYHNDNLVRIEVNENEFPKLFTESAMASVKSELKKIGFTYITLDLEGFRSGSMN